MATSTTDAGHAIRIHKEVLLTPNASETPPLAALTPPLRAMSDPQPPQQPPPEPTAARRLTPGSNAPPSELNSAELIRRRLFEKEPAEIYPTPRFARYSRMANWIVLPSVMLYCVFFVEFGSHEHVFSPVRRRVACLSTTRSSLVCSPGDGWTDKEQSFGLYRLQSTHLHAKMRHNRLNRRRTTRRNDQHYILHFPVSYPPQQLDTPYSLLQKKLPALSLAAFVRSMLAERLPHSVFCGASRHKPLEAKQRNCTGQCTSTTHS